MRIDSFDLSCLIARHDLTEFVETGYGEGDGVRAALEAGFESITSIEIIPEVAEQAGHEWADADDRVTVLENNSYDALSLVCQKLKGPICFWLDAYLPGKYGYDKPADEFSHPLEMELEIIKACRPDDMTDVILIGGLSLYERGCANPLDEWKFSGYEHSKFIERIFGDTHIIRRDLSGNGYATLLPKRAVEAGWTVEVVDSEEHAMPEPWRDDAGLLTNEEYASTGNGEDGFNESADQSEAPSEDGGSEGEEALS